MDIHGTRWRGHGGTVSDQPTSRDDIGIDGALGIQLDEIKRVAGARAEQAETAPASSLSPPPVIHGDIAIHGIPIQFARLRPLPKDDFTLPTRHYGGDAGYDLYVSRTVTVEPGLWVNIPTNTAVALPVGCWALIMGRSSTFHTKRLIVNPGIIDNGWRGELFSAVYNPTKSAVVVRRGERVTQLIVMQLTTPMIQRVGKLREGDRGEAGFGSTGL